MEGFTATFVTLKRYKFLQDLIPRLSNIFSRGPKLDKGDPARFGIRVFYDILWQLLLHFRKLLLSLFKEQHFYRNNHQHECE